MSGRVCRLRLLLALASAVVLVSESRGTHDLILLSQIRDSPNLEGQVAVFTSPRNKMAQFYQQALGSLFVPLMTRKATVYVSNALTTSPRYKAPPRTAEKTSLSLLCVLPLPGK
jgi:hypothetical protein